MYFTRQLFLQKNSIIDVRLDSKYASGNNLYEVIKNEAPILTGLKNTHEVV